MGRRIVRGSDDLSLVVVNFSSFLFNKLKLTLSPYVNGCQYLFSFEQEYSRTTKNENTGVTRLQNMHSSQT